MLYVDTTSEYLCNVEYCRQIDIQQTRAIKNFSVVIVVILCSIIVASVVASTVVTALTRDFRCWSKASLTQCVCARDATPSSPRTRDHVRRRSCLAAACGW